MFRPDGYKLGSLLLGSMILGFAGIKIVEAASIPVAPPTSFAQIQAELNNLNSQFGSDAKCGGWNTTESVAPDPPPKDRWYEGQRDSGTISWVEGAPGRRGIPLGNFESGMAWRIETGDPNRDGLTMSGFVFPSNATGLSTVCPAAGGDANYLVWCADGLGGNYDDPANPQLRGADLGSPDARTCTKNVGLPSFVNPKCTREEDCNNLCTEINSDRYKYSDCKKTEERELRDRNGNVVLDDDGNPVTYFVCTESAKKWACTGEWVDSSAPSAAAQCKTCNGAECRCPGPACDGKDPDPAIQDGKTWSSFFRHFNITSGRQGITEVPSDLLKDVRMEANCYGFYREYDPKLEFSDLNCVIGNIKTRDLQPITKERLKQTQVGKGTIRASATPDTLPNARAPYDATIDQWYTRILGAFSFLKPESPLTTGLLNPDLAKVIASVQRTVSQPFAKHSVLRSTDDTVTNESAATRRFTEWWQKISNDGNAVFTPGTIRMRLPATWNESVVPLAPVAVTEVTDSRLASIDVQLEASDDLLGRIALYLQETLRIDVHEEHVPIIVPSNSPIELRAAAQRWKSWNAERIANGVGSNPAVVTLIGQLETYAKDIERMRKLQIELPKVLSGMLDKQSDFLQGINDWAERNADTYASYQDQIQRRRDLETQWKNLLTEYGKFSDESNVPWCRNDRFTTPIYSLLDAWYPPRVVGTYPENFSPGIPTCTATTGTSLPTICLPLQEDLVIDLSILKISTGSVIVPVVKPVLVRLKIPLPGDATDIAPDPSTLRLPVLPAVPDLTAGFLLQLPPARQVSTPPDLVLPKEPNFEAIRKAIDRATVIVRRMSETYKKYWDSFIYNQTTAQQCPRGFLGPLDCCNTNDNRCQHSEMDLLERVTRFTARPAVLLKQDLQTQGIARVQLPAIRTIPGLNEGETDPRKAATCLAQDHVCQALLPVKQLPKTGWQVLLPQSSTGLNALEDMRSRARAFTIGANGQVIGSPPLPFIVPPERLTPTYEVPRAVPLSPTR